MRKLPKPPRRLIIFLGFFLSLVLITTIVYFFPPNTTFRLWILPIPVLLLFFPLLSLGLFCLVNLFVKRMLFGILVSVLTSVYLIFRINGLTHPFFLFLLLALFVTFLLLFRKEK